MGGKVCPSSFMWVPTGGSKWFLSLCRAPVPVLFSECQGLVPMSPSKPRQTIVVFSGQKSSTLPSAGINFSGAPVASARGCFRAVTLSGGLPQLSRPLVVN